MIIRSPFRRSVLSLLVGAGLLLAAPVPAQASGIKAIWGPTQLNGVSQFPLYQDLGVGIYEAQLIWSNTAPTQPRNPRDPNDPAYRWPADITHAVSAAGDAGIRVSLQIITAPPWANGGHTALWAPHPRNFADFAYAASRKYRSVHLWMVWGEPSRTHNFQPEVPAVPGTRLTRAQAGAPRLYARMLDAAYGAFKAASAKNLVIGGNTFTAGDIKPSQWIANLRLPSGRPPRLDLYGHNPFSFREPNLANPPSVSDQVDFSDLPRLARLVDRYLGRGRRHPIPLFISEFTIPTAVDSEFGFHVTPPLQAQWLASALRIMRSWSRIYAVGWIHLYDEPPGGSQGGLLYNDLEKKPSYFAFKNG